MKQAVIRQVKSMSMSCDPVGNLLLLKFSCQGASDLCLYLPGSTVFWLLKHIPVNQDPSLKQPSNMPKITQADWDQAGTPRILSVNCKQLADSLRMTFALDTGGELTAVLDRANVELMRQIMAHYAADLVDLEA